MQHGCGVTGVYAIVETGGKQYRVREGDTVRVERLAAQPGDEVVFDRVLLVQGQGIARVGSPVLADALVRGRVVGHGKGEKVLVFRYKPKKRIRRRYGHRQPYTQVRIERIEA